MRASIANHLIPRHVAGMPAMPQVDQQLWVTPSAIAGQFAPTTNGLPTINPQTFEDHYQSCADHLMDARGAADAQEWEQAKHSYAHLLGALMAMVPQADGSQKPFYEQIVGVRGSEGEELYLESVLGLAVFARPDQTKGVLDHLGFVRTVMRKRCEGACDAERGRVKGHLMRIKLARANALSRYADNIDALEGQYDDYILDGIAGITQHNDAQFVNPYETAYLAGLTGGATNPARHEYYETAEKKIKSAFRILTKHHVADAKAVRYVGKLMAVETYGRQADCAYWRKDPDASRQKILTKLMCAAKECAEGHSVLGDNGKEVAAQYIAETAVLFMRMDERVFGLKLARFLTEKCSNLATMPAVQKMLNSEEFADYTNPARTALKSHERIQEAITPNERRKLRAQAAVANAHSKSVTETLVTGALGGGLGYLASRGLIPGSSDPIQDIACITGGAALARTGMSFLNGWYSNVARGVAQTGLYDRTGWQTATDIGALAARMLGYGAAYAFPATLGRFISPAASAWVHPIAAAGQLYFVDSVNWLSQQAQQLWNNGISWDTGWFNNLQTKNDWFFAIVRPYEVLTGAYYTALFCLPWYRKYLEKMSLAFSAGAVFLSAELCMQIAGADDYSRRMLRSLIGATEMVGLLMAVGVGSLAKDGTARGAAKSFLKAFFSPSFQSSLIGMSLMVGVSSAIGGKIKASAQNFSHNPFLYLVQGGAISFSLLPLPLLISGPIKQNVTPLLRFGQFVQDAKGDTWPSVLKEAAIGPIDTLRTPYVTNKVMRPLTPWFDWFSAGLRASGDWDSNEGMLLMSVPNLIAFNNWAAMTFNDVGGTVWERRAVKGILQTMMRAQAREASSQFFDHFSKAGQRQSLFHIFQPHHWKDRGWPLLSIQRIFRQPRYPLLPNTHYFANLVQMIQNGNQEKISKAQMEGMLEHILCLADHPRNYAVMRPVVQALYAARAFGRTERHPRGAKDDDPDHRKRLDEFFESNPGLIDMLNIERSKLILPEARYRRQMRWSVLKALRMDNETYLKRVREHRANHDRIMEEKRARKRAARLAKQEMGTRADRQKLQEKFMAELDGVDDLFLRKLERMAIYKERPQSLEEQLAAFSFTGDDAKKKKKMEKKKAKFLRKRNKRIQRLAAKIAKVEGLKGEAHAERQRELAEEFADKDDDYLWHQEMSRLKDKKFKRWRIKAIKRLAAYRVRMEQRQIAFDKEMKFMKEIAQAYAEKRAASPVSGLLR